MKRLQIIIRGKVQGVGFRYYTRKKAEECHLVGFVMNKPDGSVFIEAEGDDIDVNTFADWCAQGPEWSRVLKITKSELPLVGNTKFEVR